MVFDDGRIGRNSHTLINEHCMNLESLTHEHYQSAPLISYLCSFFVKPGVSSTEIPLIRSSKKLVHQVVEFTRCLKHLFTILFEQGQ